MDEEEGMRRTRGDAGWRRAKEERKENEERCRKGVKLRSSEERPKTSTASRLHYHLVNA